MNKEYNIKIRFVDKEDFVQYKNVKTMTRHESLFAEIIYDLSYLAGQDDLTRFIEDSRELFMKIKEWAMRFDMKYPMPRQVKCDFSELYDVDYLTAIDNFYIEMRNEYMENKYNEIQRLLETYNVDNKNIDFKVTSEFSNVEL